MSSLKQLNERMEEIKERRVSHPGGGAPGRGLHSSTFQLNLSRFCHEVHHSTP